MSASGNVSFLGPNGKVVPAYGRPTHFKDEHDGISPIETIYGTRYLLKWPERSLMSTAGKLLWDKQVKPWLVEKGITVKYHNSRGSLMLPSKSDALMFKLSWDASDFR